MLAYNVQLYNYFPIFRSIFLKHKTSRKITRGLIFFKITFMEFMSIRLISLGHLIEKLSIYYKYRIKIVCEMNNRSYKNIVEGKILKTRIFCVQLCWLNKQKKNWCSWSRNTRKFSRNYFFNFLFLRGMNLG